MGGCLGAGSGEAGLGAEEEPHGTPLLNLRYCSLTQSLCLSVSAVPTQSSQPVPPYFSGSTAPCPCALSRIAWHGHPCDSMCSNQKTQQGLHLLQAAAGARRPRLAARRSGWAPRQHRRRLLLRAHRLPPSPVAGALLSYSLHLHLPAGCLHLQPQPFSIGASQPIAASSLVMHACMRPSPYSYSSAPGQASCACGPTFFEWLSSCRCHEIPLQRLRGVPCRRRQTTGCMARRGAWRASMVWWRWARPAELPSCCCRAACTPMPAPTLGPRCADALYRF